MNLKEYWEKSTPMSFIEEDFSYAEKREFRYSLQDYMHEVFHFDKYKNKRVLDLGCGSGIDSVEFARNGALVISVDFTDRAIMLTEKLFKENRLSGKVVKADILNLPFDNDTFDLVYSFGVLHHIPDIERALSEISRVLKPHGELSIMLYNKDSILYGYSIIYLRGVRGGLLSGSSQEELVSRFSERNEGCPYTKAYTKDEVKKLFSNYFDNISIAVKFNVIDLPGERKVKLGIGDKYELGWHLIVKCKKKCDKI